MLKVSTDTNTVLSGLFFDKNPEKLLLLAIDGMITLILPLTVVEEVDKKIRSKFEDHTNLGPAKEFWETLKLAFTVKDSDFLNAEKVDDSTLTDEKDKPIFQEVSKICPDCFITGDDDFFRIADPPFEIVRLRAFFNKYFPKMPLV